MQIRFLGDWNPWLGVGLAVAAAVTAWLLYRREARGRGRILAWLLPVLRAAAILMAILLLTGPVLHRRHVTGERGRVLVFVDGSRSMGLPDEGIEASRKLVAAHRLGWLPAEAVDLGLAEAADALARARASAGGDAVDPARWRDAARALAREVEAAQGHLGRVKSETGGTALERRGVVLREVWTSVPGSSVDELRRHPAFPAKPDQSSTHDLFEAPSNWGDNYGTRLRGFLHPPTTGNYTFWVAGDDHCELWISADADPARRAVVARVPAYSDARGWDQAPEQKSAPVRLVAGQKYYIEALQKESTGGDALAVGWQLPDGKMERPIPGTRLSAPLTSGESPASAVQGMVARFREEVLAPAQTLASGRLDAAKAVAAFPPLLSAVSRWETSLRDAFANYANRVAAQPSDAVQKAFQRFDAAPRWARAEALLLGGEKPLVATLAEKHRVEVLALDGPEARLLWSGGTAEARGAKDLPRGLAPLPGAPVTNLADAVKARVGDRDEERSAVVLLSDGRHNEGSSPIQAARMFGNRQIPVLAVGYGTTGFPEDLAVVDVRAPASVFFKDRVRGEIVLKDDMPAGRPFTLKIEANGETLWEKRLLTERSHRRRVPFDFPVQGLVEKRAGAKEAGLEVLSLPLTFQATVQADGERERRNNDASFSLYGVVQKRKALILDGRPRWELRYVRNLFDRDEQWEVTALLADRVNGNGEGWPRGKGADKFPADRETLFGYDLVVFGEVPRQFLKLEELEWLRDFVDKRGGGLLFIDGRRGHMSGYADTPLGALLPVDWKAEGGRPTALRPTQEGAERVMLQLAPEREKSLEIWASLQAPHWVAPARALKGAETWLEAVVGERRVPALVHRRFGAGRVLWAGFDESWRWRYEVADLHHRRYWNQLVREIMEPPFTVRDERVSLGVGKLVYGPGEPVEVRARLRGDDGRPLAKADAEAEIWADKRRVASAKLTPDENAGGLFHAQMAALPSGTYEVRLRGAGGGRVSTSFTVQSAETAELAELTCHEDLLRQLASHSGGLYVREEDARSIEARLEPLSREKVIESDLALHGSWAWFVPLVLLLTVEWVLRKWAGML
ncbi:MAG TPA: PA14 domain-containing protein [Planctomycetota bacterium]|nr:PA14 domain-containing protein [Planctomycetota bacterium]